MLSRDAVRFVHGCAGGLGLAVIATFLSATVVVEVAAEPATIAATKRAIAWGLVVLVPALAAAGLTGMRLSGGAKAGKAGRKAARMRIIAANGLLVLVPAAVFLAVRAASWEFDAVFYAVQALELMAGATNLVLLGRNMRDGMAMRAARLRRTPAGRDGDLTPSR